MAGAFDFSGVFSLIATPIRHPKTTDLFDKI